MKKYTVEQFTKKYSGQRGISCGINYTDGSHDIFMGGSFSQLMSYLKVANKEVAFIVSR